MPSQMTIFDRPPTEDYGQKFDRARDRVFFLMRDQRWHTWKELREVGGLRYGARIHELKREGYRVESIRQETGKAYRLISLKKFTPDEKKVRVYLHEKDVAALASTPELPQHVRDALFNALDSFEANKGNL